MIRNISTKTHTIKFTFAIAIFLLVLIVAPRCEALTILAEYKLPFAWNSNVPFPATASSQYVTAGDMTLIGLNGMNTNGFFASDWGHSFDPNKYISFTIEPTSGLILEFSAMSFTVASSQHQPEFFGGPNTYFLEYRTVGGNWFDLITVTNVNAAVVQVNNADISAIGPQTNTIEFGLFGDEAIGTLGQWGGYASHSVAGAGESITITGTVVPEPSTFSMMLLGLFILPYLLYRKSSNL